MRSEWPDRVAGAGVCVKPVARTSRTLEAPVSAFGDPIDPIDPLEEPVDKDLKNKLTIAIFELNFLMSLAIARGIPVTLDVVERDNPRVPGTTYHEVIDTGGVL